MLIDFGQVVNRCETVIKALKEAEVKEKHPNRACESGCSHLPVLGVRLDFEVHHLVRKGRGGLLKGGKPLRP